MRIFFLFIFLLLLSTSCSFEDETYNINTPYSNHLEILDLNEGVKSVDYRKQYFKIVENGGYFPKSDDDKRDITFLYVISEVDLPFTSNHLYYKLNLNPSIYYNMAVLFSDLYLFREISSSIVGSSSTAITFYESGKIKTYQSLDTDGNPTLIKCKYDEKNRLKTLTIDKEHYLGNTNEVVEFNYKGNLIAQINFDVKDESNIHTRRDTVFNSFEKLSSNEIRISFNDSETPSGVYTTNLFLDESDGKLQVDKLEFYSKEKLYSYLEFKDSRIVKNYNVDENDNYNFYKTYSYQGSQIKSIEQSDKTESSRKAVRLELDSNNDISSIVALNKNGSFTDIGLNMNYKHNSRNEWVEMELYFDREPYDKAVIEVNDLKRSMRNAPNDYFYNYYSGRYYQAVYNKSLLESMLSKTILNRNIKYY